MYKRLKKFTVDECSCLRYHFLVNFLKFMSLGGHMAKMLQLWCFYKHWGAGIFNLPSYNFVTREWVVLGNPLALHCLFPRCIFLAKYILLFK